MLYIQVASENRRHKISYHLQRSTPEADEAVLQQLRDSLAAAGLAAKVIYSGGLDVDILAQGAGKGKALEFILKELKEAGAYPPDGVQVCTVVSMKAPVLVISQFVSFSADERSVYRSASSAGTPSFPFHGARSTVCC